MKPLVAVTTVAKHGRSPGPPPLLAWLPISQLFIDETYQRPVEKTGRQNIERIAAQFDWACFSPVIVAAAGEDTYAIIDGQHRCTAALSLGYKKVPCYIVKASAAKAASIFAAVNGQVTPMTAFQIYKAALAAGDDWALGIKAEAGRAGVQIPLHPIPTSRMAPRQTLAIMLCRRIWREGPETLHACFVVGTAGLDGAQPGILSARLIRHLWLVFKGRPGWMRDLDGTRQAVAGLRLSEFDFEQLLTALGKRMGSGLERPADVDALRARVKDLAARGFNSGMIAGQLRLPYARVDQLLRGTP